MAKKQHTLAEKVEIIAHEMCRDLGLDDKEWERFKDSIQKNLEEDAMLNAKEKLWNGKIGQDS